MLTLERNFKIGDDVTAFEWRKEARWKPLQILSYDGEILAIKNGKIYVDTAFGILPFDEVFVEHDWVPF